MPLILDISLRISGVLSFFSCREESASDPRLPLQEGVPQVSTVCSTNISTVVTIRSQDVSGGGDCFYHRVAAGLERLLLHSTVASRHVLRRTPLNFFPLDRRAVVKYFRNLCVQQISH